MPRVLLTQWATLLATSGVMPVSTSTATGISNLARAVPRGDARPAERDVLAASTIEVAGG